MRPLAATDRTIGAIRKADALPLVVPGGKMRKGAYPQSPGGGETWEYDGMFAIADTSTYGETPTYQVTVAAGLAWVSTTWISVDGATVAIPAGFVGADPDWGYLVANFVEDNPLPVFDGFGVVTSATLLGLEDGHHRALIGRVRVVTGTPAVLSYIQDRYGVIVGATTAPCPEE